MLFASKTIMLSSTKESFLNLFDKVNYKNLSEEVSEQWRAFLFNFSYLSNTSDVRYAFQHKQTALKNLAAIIQHRLTDLDTRYYCIEISEQLNLFKIPSKSEPIPEIKEVKKFSPR